VTAAATTFAGGVYKPPLVNVPTAGLIVHVMFVFDEPLMNAANCWAGVPA